MRNREMVKTQDFKKGKLEIFGFTRPPSRARDFEQMQEIPPPHFFRQLILRDTPCLTFRHSALLRQSAKPKW